MIISVKLAPETLFLVHKVLLDEIQTKPADTRAKKALKSILIELFNVFVKKCISYGNSPNGRTEKYREAGISWWDYCGPMLVNSYPTYFEQLPPLIDRINKEKRNSKNYVLFLGRNDTETNQQPCLSLIQFQIDNGKLVISAYQRSSDASLGLPADLYHLYLISRQIDLPLKSITLTLGNVHIYENNIDSTKRLLKGEKVSFELNV